MLKLLVVTPNPTVYDATVRIVQTTKFDAEVIQTTSRQVVEDVKSRPTRTREYAMKKKMLKDRFGIDITEV